MLVDFSEGNVVVGDSLVGVGILFMGGGTRPAKDFRVAARVAPAIAGASAFPTRNSAQQGQFIDQDFRAVLLFTGGLVVPGPSLNLALDEELSALLHIVADDLGRALEGDEAVPFGLVFPVAMAVLLPVSGGERKAGNSHATCR